MPTRTRKTTYSDHIHATLYAMYADRVGGFTCGDVARRAGVGVTHNLRRTIRDLVDGGYLKPCWYYQDAGLSYTFISDMWK